MEAEIRERLVDYLAGEVSRGDLEAWLLAETWELDDTDEPAAAALAYGALRAISERAHEHIPERGLRGQLAMLALTASLGEPAHSVTATSSPTHRQSWALPGLSRFAVADTRSEVVSA